MTPEKENIATTLEGINFFPLISDNAITLINTKEDDKFIACTTSRLWWKMSDIPNHRASGR